MSKKNPFDKYMKNIFNKIYLANVGNRLRELENPSNVDCKRWIWELIQNAKDSISGRKDRKNVDIEINVENDFYQFKHNGSPFTMENLTALLYKYSEGKKNNSESTGRFGTGFLTTHSLSKIVKISSDVIDEEDNYSINGFKVTLFREGEENELLDGLKRTEDSYEKLENSLGWTTYEYIAKTNRNREAGKLGIKNFKENICLVMLFCPEINNIKLNDNGKIFTIERDNEINDENNQFQKIIFKVKDDDILYKRIFIYYKINEKNEELSTKFDKDRNLRITCAIEIDENNNIIINKILPCLFCSLPLVGSEKHELPFYINSPDFEPDSERQALLLDGVENDEKTGKITNTGINKMILLRTMEIYNDFLSYIHKNNIKKRYLLIRGINSIPAVTRFFDSEWYEESYICPMRNILLENPIIFNGNEYKKLTEVYIPKLSYYNQEKIKINAYTFISQLHNKKVPNYEESIIIDKWIWKNDPRIIYKDIEDCAKIVQECQNMLNIVDILNNNDTIWKWINEFIKFVHIHHYQYIYNYAIIPNMNLEFVKLTKTLASSKDVPDNLIECMEKLDINWKANHTHKKINFEAIIDHKINVAITLINGQIDEFSRKTLILMTYIPDDIDIKFKAKRENMYELCKLFWKDKMLEKKNGNQFPKELWTKADNLIFKTIIDKIEENETIEEPFTIEVMQKFIKCAVQYYPSYREHNIIPNKNGYFCCIDELYKDDDIPEIFKECLENCFDIDINEELIDDRITSIKTIKKKTINDYKDLLNEYFHKKEHRRYRGDDYLPVEKKIEAAEYLIRIIPTDLKIKLINENKDNNDEKNEINENYVNNIILNNQRMLFEIYNFFTGKKCEYYEIERDKCDYYSLWYFSNKYILEIIKNIIEKNKDLDSLCKSLVETDELIVEKLNKFFNLCEIGNIILNQNNQFCEKSQLYNEKDWEKGEELKNIALLLGYNVKEKLVHEKMKSPKLNNMKNEEICKEIDDIFTDKYKNISNHKNADFKKAAKILSNYIDSIGELKAGKNFPKVFAIKESITYNVIYDEKTRKDFANLEKAFNLSDLSKLSENKEIKDTIKSFIDDEGCRKNFMEFGKMFKEKGEDFKERATDFFSLEKKFGKEGISKLLTNTKFSNFILKIVNNSKIVNNFDRYDTMNFIGFFNDLDKPLNESYKSENNSISSNNYYSESAAPVNYNINKIEPYFKKEISKSVRIKYKEDYNYESKNDNDDIDKEKRIRIIGQIYIYELLNNSGKFKNVNWIMLNESENEEYEIFEYNEKRYRLMKNEFYSSYYDILAETFDDSKIYIKVKSEKNDFDKNIPIYINNEQIEMMKKTEIPNEYMFAMVFKTLEEPNYFFLSLKKNLINN